MAKCSVIDADECLNHSACTLTLDDELRVVGWGSRIRELLPDVTQGASLESLLDLKTPMCGFEPDKWRLHSGECFCFTSRNDPKLCFDAYPVAYEPQGWLVMIGVPNEQGTSKGIVNLEEQIPPCKDNETECEALAKAMQLLEQQQGRLELTETQHRLVKRELDRLQQHLVESEKMAMCGEMLAGFSHDLKTPLGVCIGAVSVIEVAQKNFTKALGQGLTKSVLNQFMETLSESHDILQKNLQRSLHLLENLKQLSWDQFHDERRQVDLGKYTEELLETLHPLYRKKQIEIITELDVDETVETYPGSFSRILSNLLINAVRHAFVDDRESKQIVIALTVDRQNISLEVRDNGVGIAPDVLPHIFEPYFTTAEDDGGTGLGLNIVHHLIEGLSGEVRCESVPGEGTSFFIRFPTDQQ
ncbi:sensor histidine kinase [Dongshaea marina]|uniref:sensor histidine kinase n=1 Tax=Dongshaea marina TaxID=2047966 RepID=UPI000D3ED596|nr:HAMP domain-containing sensor histidine kinase [Dongshaea marina]